MGNIYEASAWGSDNQLLTQLTMANTPSFYFVFSIYPVFLIGRWSLFYYSSPLSKSFTFFLLWAAVPTLHSPIILLLLISLMTLCAFPL